MWLTGGEKACRGKTLSSDELLFKGVRQKHGESVNFLRMTTGGASLKIRRYCDFIEQRGKEEGKAEKKKVEVEKARSRMAKRLSTKDLKRE